MEKLLLVVDMQNDFITGKLGTPEAEAIVPKVKRKIELWDGDIAFTQDSHHSQYLFTREGKRLPVEHCLTGTKGWEIHEDLRQFQSTKRCTGVFRKHSFGRYRLPYELLEWTEEGYDEVQIVGLCTDICVISNALVLRSAWTETDIVVDASCCAGTTPEMHEAALKVMKSCQVDIINWPGQQTVRYKLVKEGVYVPIREK